MRTDGLVLAAGAGRRRGLPKVLVPGALVAAVAALSDGGCDAVTVVVGAAGEQAAALVPPGTATVVADDWSTGMGAALRTGLAAVTGDAALVHLVDLPDVGPDVVRRLLRHTGRAALARAVYDDVPGHPVLLGRDHFAGAAAAALGDRGARDYLSNREVLAVECGDLATGIDVDFPE